MKTSVPSFFPAVRIFTFLTLVTGIAYPLLVTLVAQIGFKDKANGSLIFKMGKIIGSELIAQKFEKPQYFWPRPSAIDYNPMPSGGSNLGPTSADLKAKLEERKKQGLTDDLLFASASGLDPHISIGAARAQAPRIATALKIPTQQVMSLIDQLTEDRQLKLFGDPHVNVLRLNLALDDRLQTQSR